MPNPDSSTPSIQALDKAVKPAGFQSWDEFCTIYHRTGGVNAMALAYAADLDKADKVGRMAEQFVQGKPERLKNLVEAARELILHAPIDPDLLEAKAVAERIERERLGQNMTVSELIREGIRRGRDLQIATELRAGRELAKEQDRG